MTVLEDAPAVVSSLPAEQTTAKTVPAVPPVAARRHGSRALAMLASLGWGIIGAAVFVAIWWVGSTRVAQLPGPAETFTQLKDWLSDPFYDNGPNDQGVGHLVWSSLQRVGWGFGLAALVGVPVGLLMGSSRRAWQAANPIVQFLRPVSPLAWYPIWLVILSDAPNAAKWVIFITALWPIVINTAAGAATVPNDQRAVAKVFRFGRVAYVRHVLVPHTLPSIVTGLRLSMGVAWLVIVAVEMMAGGIGIGNYVWTEYNAFAFDKVLAAVLVIGAVGLVLDLLFLRLGRAVAIEEEVGQ